mgnify:CR=1 FL=1
MSAIISEFNAAVYITEQMNRMIINAAQELAQRAVSKCADKYDFDAAEAIKFLGLQNIKVERNRPEKVAKAPKEKAVKAAFPMPWNGVCIAGCCSALRQNQGLYTQCTGSLKKNAVFCKQCQVNADKNGGVPEYGTVAMRQAVGLYDYVDPKGRKPVSFTKIMKKYKIDQAAAMEEAAKFGINIDAEHFIVPEADKKKGRPKAEKAPKEKGAKGRPKKAKKMLQIEGDDDDLFASLVADANANTSAEPEKKKRGKSDEEKAAEEAKKAAEKAEKEAKKAAEKAEKEAKLAAEKAAKEEKAAFEKAQRELKKQKEEQEKAEKKAAAELAKKEKEAKLAAEKAAKEAEKEAKKASKKPAAAATTVVAEPEPEPDVVKKIEFEGKKYLKSKKTGIVYDYNEYVKNGEQVVVGKWNDAKNKIDFNKASDEESEEEYAM